MSLQQNNNLGLSSDAKRDWSGLVFATGLLLFLIRLVGPGWRQGFPPSFVDSTTFLEASSLGPLSSNFWLNDRPVGLPLLLWVLQSNTRALIIVQTIVYISASIYLFRTLLMSIHHRIVSWIAILIAASLLSHHKFAMWNLEVLSESLLISTLVFLFALLIRFIQQPTSSLLTSICLSLVVLLLLRDINIVLVGFSLVGILACCYYPTFAEFRKHLLRIAVVLIIGCLFVLVAQSESNRFQYGVINNVGLRVLPDNSLKNKFFEGETEVLQSIENRAGKNAWDDDQAFLVDPSLQPFRNWVNSSGRTALLVSLLADSAFWKNQITQGLDSTLAYSFSDYDRFGSASRLPQSPATRILPSTSFDLLALLALSFAACGILIIKNLRRREAKLLLGMTFISLTYVAISVFADAVEIQRHSVPPLLFAMLTIVGAFALFADSVVGRIRPNPADKPKLAPIPHLTSFAGGGFIVLLLMALIALEFRTQDWDPSFARTIIERVSRFGGTYYQNGIWHHGPIDALLYDIPRFFTTFGTYWFGVAFIVLSMSALVAFSIIRISDYFGTIRPISLALGSAVFLHFTISSSDYAGVIYSRNTTTTILIATFAFALSRRPWHVPTAANRSFIIAFAALGITVQTMVSSLMTAVVIGGCVYILHNRHVTLRRPLIWGCGTFVAAIATAPAWYFIRGSFGEFWANWWVMARHMNTATNRTLWNQFTLGWDKFYEYYTQRPALLVILVVFVLLLALRWTSMKSSHQKVGLSILLWFAASWVELAVSQRYSSHYFVISTIPTTIMLSFVISQVFPQSLNTKIMAIREVSFVPALFVSIVMLFVQCSDLFWSGVEGLGRYQSVQQHEKFVADNRSGESKTIRAVLDLVSSDNDGLLAWTMFPWTYLEHQRVPATRLSWKSFMLGEIYLASTSEKYILSDTWKWFDADMRQSQPNAYLHPKEVPVVDGIPFSNYVSQNFVNALETEKHLLAVRQSLWNSITSPRPTTSTTMTSAKLAPTDAPITLATDRCQRIDLTIVRLPGNPDSSVEITFHQASPEAAQSVIRIETNQIQALANGYPQHSQALPPQYSTEIPISVLLGSRSAAVVIQGRIATAIRLKSPTAVSATTVNGMAGLTEISTTPAPYLSQCQ